jgi:sulfate-transporting ATPase
VTTAIQFAVLGLGICAVYTLLVQGLIVIYSGSGVVNFAHGAMAMVSAYMFWQLRRQDGWAFAPAFLTCVGMMAVIGALWYLLVMRPLRHASTMSAVVATLGLLIVMQGVTALEWGTNAHILLTELPNHVYTVRGVYIPEDRLWLVGIAIALTAALWAAYRFTRSGLAIRGAAENQRGVAALGWSADTMGALTWAVGSALAGAAGVLIGPLVGLSIDQMPLLVVPVLAAGLVGGFTSFWGAFAGAFFIGISQSEALNYIDVQGITWALPFAIIVVLLVVRGKGLPVRGYVSERLPAVGNGVAHWKAIVPLVVTAGVLIYTVFPASLLDATTVSMSWAVLMLSVVVLLGYTAQLSFEQMAMAGIATLIAARLIHWSGVPFGVAAIVAVLAAAPIGAAFALPALRTRGVNLAVVTLGLGAVVAEMILQNPTFVITASGIDVGTPHLFGISLDGITHPERYALFTLIVMVVCALAVANVRRGKSGSALIAVRTNERAAAALGISVLQTKLFAFIVGAALASIGGILFSFRASPVAVDQVFTPFQSILVVSYAVIGGVGFAIGPMLGMVLTVGGIGGWIVNELWPGSRAGSFWLTIAGGAAVVLILLQDPDGLVQMNIKAAKAAEGQNKLALLRLEVLLLRSWAMLRRAAWMPVFLQPKPPRPPEALPEVERGTMSVRPSTLEVKGLTVRYGGVTAAQDISFTIRPGEILGLIGPNGAGKTTVIDAVTGFTRAAEGSIALDGEPIDGWPAHKRARAGISRSFQGLELFESSTVRDNLRVASDPREFHEYWKDIVHPGHRPLSQAAIAAVQEFELRNELDVVVTDLPYGHRRLTALVRAIAIRPSILLLDEPAAGLSGPELSELAAIIRRLASEWGLGFLVVEHEMAFVMDVCDRIVVLDFGRTIAEGTPAEVRANPLVIDAYLGTPHEGAPAPDATVETRS